MAVIDSETVTITLWCLVLVVELGMYFVDIAVVPDDHQWRLSPTYAIERDNVWVFLVLGEIVIALATSSTSRYDVEFYSSLILGFLLIYVLMRIFCFSQPSAHATDIFVHALHGSALRALLRSVCQFLMSFGVLCVGVGIKFGLSKSHQEYRRPHAWMLVGGLSFALVFLHICRFTNFYDMSIQDAQIYNMPSFNYKRSLHMRWAIWTLQIVVALCLLPLALLVETSRNANGVSSRITLSQLLSILLAAAIFTLLLDVLALPSRMECALVLRKRKGVPLRSFGSVCYRNPRALPTPSSFEVPVLIEARTGKQLWDIARHHVTEWRQVRRVAKMFSSVTRGELQLPGNHKRAHNLTQMLYTSSSVLPALEVASDLHRLAEGPSPRQSPRASPNESLRVRNHSPTREPTRSPAQSPTQSPSPSQNVPAVSTVACGVLEHGAHCNCSAVTSSPSFTDNLVPTPLCAFTATGLSAAAARPSTNWRAAANAQMLGPLDESINRSESPTPALRDVGALRPVRVGARLAPPSAALPPLRPRAQSAQSRGDDTQTAGQESDGDSKV